MKLKQLAFELVQKELTQGKDEKNIKAKSKVRMRELSAHKHHIPVIDGFFSLSFSYVLDFFSEAMSLLEPQHWCVLSLKLRAGGKESQVLQLLCVGPVDHTGHPDIMQPAMRSCEGRGPRLLPGQTSSTRRLAVPHFPVTRKSRRANILPLCPPLRVHGLPLTA